MRREIPLLITAVVGLFGETSQARFESNNDIGNKCFCLK